MIYIYTLTDPFTEEIRYVGKTVNIKRRIYLHKYESERSKTHKAKWVKSLYDKGSEPIFEIIDIANNEEWEFWECYWIQQMKAWGFNLCNLTNGGDGVKQWSDEMRQNMSNIKKGQKGWNVGTPMSDNSKLKLSKSKKGKESAFKNKHHTEEFKIEKSKQMIEYFKENEHGRVGKKHTNKSIELMSKNARVNKLSKKPISQYTKEGLFLRHWDSVIDAGKELNIIASNIRQMCKTNEFHRIIGGFKWKYKN